MKENKPIQNEEEVKPPNNPQDAVHDQLLNSPSTNEPIVPAAETTPEVEQPQTTNYKLQTEEMEVHHHTHPGHHKKKWTDYFWEFLMLFLAVFCGFMAENIREHKIEHLRAKEFAKSLVQDLQNDTIAINTQKKTAGIYIVITDSLLRLSQTPLEGRHAAEFSFFTRFLYWTAPLSWNRTTFEQVKNSGSLRYFRNFQLLGKLMKYVALVNEIEGEFSNHQTRGNMLLKLINEIIDPQLHHDLSKHQLLSLDTMSRETREGYFTVETATLENKRIEIRELLNMAVVQQRNLRYNETRLLRAKVLANELINNLKNEYHLK